MSPVKEKGSLIFVSPSVMGKHYVYRGPGILSSEKNSLAKNYGKPSSDTLPASTTSALESVATLPSGPRPEK